MDRDLKVARPVKKTRNPSGPAESNRRGRVVKNAPAPSPSSFAVSPDGRVFPASEYDPSKWHVFVEA